MIKLTDNVENLTVAAVAQAVKIQRGHGASPTRIAQVADDVVATLTGLDPSSLDARRLAQVGIRYSEGKPMSVKIKLSK